MPGAVPAGLRSRTWVPAGAANVQRSVLYGLSSSPAVGWFRFSGAVSTVASVDRQDVVAGAGRLPGGGLDPDPVHAVSGQRHVRQEHDPPGPAAGAGRQHVPGGVQHLHVGVVQRRRQGRVGAAGAGVGDDGDAPAGPAVERPLVQLAGGRNGPGGRAVGDDRAAVRQRLDRPAADRTIDLGDPVIERQSVQVEAGPGLDGERADVERLGAGNSRGVQSVNKAGRGSCR